MCVAIFVLRLLFSFLYCITLSLSYVVVCNTDAAKWSGGVVRRVLSSGAPVSSNGRSVSVVRGNTSK